MKTSKLESVGALVAVIMFLGILATVVTATLLSNVVVNSEVTIIADINCAVENSAGQGITSWIWSCMQGQFVTLPIYVFNNGDVTVYLSQNSLNSTLPVNVGALTWNANVTDSNVILIEPGALSPLITLTLTVLSNAPVGQVAFNIIITAYMEENE
jgi:hypothetical protein